MMLLSYEGPRRNDAPCYQVISINGALSTPDRLAVFTEVGYRYLHKAGHVRSSLRHCGRNWKLHGTVCKWEEPRDRAAARGFRRRI